MRLPHPHDVLDHVLDACGEHEVPALAYAWEDWWARAPQLAPDGQWRSWGGLTGRGWGKTRAMAEHVHTEAMSGRAMRIALIAQREDDVYRVMIEGESGLIAVSPPWARARLHGGEVVWPNGARAFVYTPEKPDNCFGPEHHLLWTSELHAWPASGREKALANLRMGLRLGYGRHVWDSNPRRKHPLIRMLLDRGARDPARHVVFRGTTFDNRDNLTPEALDEWVSEYGGTRRGSEMLDGAQLDDDDGALWKQIWIDAHRREMPTRLKRRVIAIDPAISMRRNTDATGIVECGMCDDGQVVVLDDLTGHLSWEVWGAMVIERYLRGRCDCVVVERNRGGDAVAANLRTYAAAVGARVVLALPGMRTEAVSDTIYVREVIGRTSKESRAEPVASAYERGRVSHVGTGLADLEDELVSWEPAPGATSPNRLDALVWAVWELLGLGKDSPKDQSGNVRAAAQLQRDLARASAARPAARIVPRGSGRGGSRI